MHMHTVGLRACSYSSTPMLTSKALVHIILCCTAAYDEPLLHAITLASLVAVHTTAAHLCSHPMLYDVFDQCISMGFSLLRRHIMSTTLVKISSIKSAGHATSRICLNLEKSL